MSNPLVSEDADSPAAVDTYLAALWRKILRRDDIESDASFFDLGGGSIHVVQMLAEVCKHFDIDLDYRRFFEAPSLDVLRGLVAEKIAS
jgi:acyl carrier protein